jgi:hypothetical protein
MARTSPTLWLYALAFYAALFVFTFGCLPFAWYLYSWRDTTPRGPLPTPADWPEPIRDLHSKMTQAGVVSGPFEVYLIYGEPGSTLSTVICRMPKTAEAVEFVTATLGMKDVTDAELPYVKMSDRAAENSAPSGWWATSNASTQVFASQQILIGGEGDLYIMAINPEEDRIFIYYEFNF